MKKIILSSTSLFFSVMVFAQAFTIAEKTNWAKQAKGIEIIKDNWGVPHIYTNTDADAVFGMMYVQCEEYFSKVEDMIISRLGRTSEVQGKSSIYKDLWSRLYIESIQLCNRIDYCRYYTIAYLNIFRYGSSLHGTSAPYT